MILIADRVTTRLCITVPQGNAWRYAGTDSITGLMNAKTETKKTGTGVVPHVK